MATTASGEWRVAKLNGKWLRKWTRTHTGTHTQHQHQHQHTPRPAARSEEPKHELLARLKATSQCAPRPVFFCACCGMSLANNKQQTTFPLEFFSRRGVGGPAHWTSCAITQAKNGDIGSF
jgi:hypothetical protein